MMQSPNNKQTGINMLANIISYSANIIISFILTPYLINALGKETYSFYPIANTIVTYMSVLTNAMNTAASRYVTIALVKDEKLEANRYYSSTLAANLLMSGVLAVFMALVVVFLDRLMVVPINAEVAIKALFSLVFASALVNISSSVFGIATFAKNRIDLRSVRELVTAALKLLLFFLMYRFMTPSIVYVGVVTLVVALVNICFQIGYTKKLLPEIKVSRSFISWSHTKSLLTTSGWSAVNTFGNIMLTGMSMVLANMLYGATASGTYAIVNTVPQFINGVICMLVGVFYPLITYRYAQGDYKGLVKEVQTAQSLCGLFGCAVISVFSALAAEFFSLWTPAEDARYLSVLSFITILPHFVIACMWSLTNLNVAMNKVKIPAMFTLGSGVINVLTACLVHRVWAPGLVSLPLISSGLQIIWVGIFVPLYACRNLNVKWSTFYNIPVKALLCSAVVIVAITLVKSVFTLNTWLRFIVFGGVCGIIALIAFASVLIGPKSMKLLIGAIVRKLKT